MARLRVGIIGAGSVSELHARGYRDSPDAVIVAVCDPNEDLAISKSLEWGANRYYTDVNEMLKDTEIDAVDIMTPNNLHGPVALAALKSGKHVSVERPLATSIDQADAIIKAAAEHKKVLQVFEPNLFYKPLLDARNLIDAGEIGKPTSLRIAATLGTSSAGVWSWSDKKEQWRFDPEQSGGSPMMFEVGYQSFAIALFLIGSVEKISLWRSDTKVNDMATIDAPSVAMWKHYQQDCYGTLNFTYAPERKMRTEYHPLEFQIAIAGTKGEIEVLRTSDPTALNSPVLVKRDARRVAYGQKTTAFEDSFVRATRNFVNACHGKEEPLLRGVEAKQLLILTLAYQESGKRGRSISLQQA